MTIAEAVSLLQADYKATEGAPFKHFFCPILHLDEDVELCKGHIVSKTFQGSSNTWIVQRKDVDNFFGAVFESEFEKLQYRDVPATEYLRNPKLAKKIKPQLMLDGKLVDYHFGKRADRKGVTPVSLPGGNNRVHLNLEMHQDEVVANESKKWTLRVQQDVRLPAVVSLIRSAHLTLFRMLGYNYVLSGGGRFVGQDLLGRFYLENYSLARDVVLANAAGYFTEFRHMVRPVLSQSAGLEGTIDDNRLYLCDSDCNAKSTWAMMVFVKVGTSMHAVLMPVMENADCAARFMSFLQSDDERIAARPCHFDDGAWRVSPEGKLFAWPNTDVSFT